MVNVVVVVVVIIGVVVVIIDVVVIGVVVVNTIFDGVSGPENVSFLDKNTATNMAMKSKITAITAKSILQYLVFPVTEKKIYIFRFSN